LPLGYLSADHGRMVFQGCNIYPCRTSTCETREHASKGTATVPARAVQEAGNSIGIPAFQESSVANAFVSPAVFGRGALRRAY
ncbi:hypothetical protein, partial [Martelella sp. FOR1707]